MIKVNQIRKNFGGVTAVDNVSIDISTGSITGVIGPNGAGKTTLFNLISGNVKPSSGRVFFDGSDVTGMTSNDLFHKGLLRTFQIPHEFGKLTALENLLMVPGNQTGESLLSSWIRPKQIQHEEKINIEKARDVLHMLKLGQVENELAGNLSGGQKKLLELGRTMMVEAKAVLLDEVGAGVNRTLLRDIEDIIIKLHRDLGYTFFMIEHDLEFISRLCNHVIVLSEGAVLMEGTPREVQENETVIEAYLGAKKVNHH